MNAERRKKLAEAAASLATAESLLEEARDEEQDCLDNMPEGFQNGEKGEEARFAIDAMDEAIQYVDAAASSVETAGES